MEKIHENMCFDVVFLYENIRTCLFTYVFLYFLHLVLTFTPHYIIMVKGLLINRLSRVVNSVVNDVEEVEVDSLEVVCV